MKKIITLFLLLCLTASLFAGCGRKEEKSTTTPTETVTEAPTDAPTDEPTAEPTKPAYTSVKMNVAVLKGPTSIGMVKLMSEAESKQAKNDYTFTVAGTADEIPRPLSKATFRSPRFPATWLPFCTTRPKAALPYVP